MKGVNTQVFFEVQTRELIEYVRRRAMKQSESSDSPSVPRYRKQCQEGLWDKPVKSRGHVHIRWEEKEERKKRNKREKRHGRLDL